MSKERTPLSPDAEKALALLKDKGPLTIAQMKELGFNVNSSHLVALRNRGMVESVEIVVEVPTITKRKVQLYTIVSE